jgi:FkbM family methyltransferase
MNSPSGIEALPNGQWVVEGDTHLGKWAKEHGDIVSDPYLMAFLDEHLKDAKVVWCVGANIGDHALHHHRKGRQVVAIEPRPDTFECLRHNVPEALCLNFAASDREGTVNLMGLENVGASRIHPSGEWTVPAFPLDDVPHLPPPGFVSIDTEGWEPMVVTGMAGTITRYKPILFVEMNEGALEANGYSPEGLHDQILGLGYSEFKIYPEGAKFGDPQFDILYLS